MIRSMYSPVQGILNIVLFFFDEKKLSVYFCSWVLGSLRGSLAALGDFGLSCAGRDMPLVPLGLVGGRRGRGVAHAIPPAVRDRSRERSRSSISLISNDFHWISLVFIEFHWFVLIFIDFQWFYWFWDDVVVSNVLSSQPPVKSYKSISKIFDALEVRWMRACNAPSPINFLWLKPEKIHSQWSWMPLQKKTLKTLWFFLIK